ARLAGDKPFGFEAIEGFARGRPGDVQGFRELALLQDCSGRKLALDQHSQKTIVDLLAEALFRSLKYGVCRSAHHNILPRKPSSPWPCPGSSPGAVTRLAIICKAREIVCLLSMELPRGAPAIGKQRKQLRHHRRRQQRRDLAGPVIQRIDLDDVAPDE